MYKKRPLDYADAHRDAVNRLKFLLAESYTPVTSRKSSICGSIMGGNVGGTANDHHHHHHHSTHHGKHEDSDDSEAVVSLNMRPSIAEISKYWPVPGKAVRSTSNPVKSYVGAHSGRYTAPSNGNICVTGMADTASSSAPPPEILKFIEKQEGYIEQLEKESHFCREELNNLLVKVKDVISENEAFTDQARAGGVCRTSRSPARSEKKASSEAVELSDSGAPPILLQSISKTASTLAGPNIVFESRISELEALLSQSGIDLRRLKDENELMKRKLVDSQSVNDGSSEVYKKQLEHAQRDKQTMGETIKKLQQNIEELSMNKANNVERSLRTRDLAHSESEIKRLKDELERQHDRMQEMQNEMLKYNKMDQLGDNFISQWEASSQLQMEMDRHRRIENDFRREMAQKKALIDDLRSELNTKTGKNLRLVHSNK